MLSRILTFVKMAGSKLSLFFVLLVLVRTVLLLPPLVYCNDDEDNLLQGVNSYRTSMNLPALTRNDKADCMADGIVGYWEDQPCTLNVTNPQSAINYNDEIKKCKINVTTAKDGVVLLVCVPKLVPTLVLTNYTHTQHSRFLNNSNYTGVGLGSKDNWMVMILTTNTVAGSFSGAAYLVPKVGLGSYWLSVLLGLLVCLVC